MKTFFLFLFLGSSFAHADIYRPSGGDVQILAIGKPSFIKIRAKGSAATGTVADSGSGDLSFDLRSLDSGIDTRNEHMKTKYLEVEKFPEAKLHLEKATEGSFQGVLTLHGQSHPVTGQFSGAASKAVDAHFKVKLSDYGIAVPTFAGVTVADDVEISVHIDELKKN